MKKAQSRFGLIFSGMAVLLLVGCGSIFNNFVEERIPQNASNIYTFSFQAKPSMANVLKGSVRATIVINGERHAMQAAEENPMIFSYDYRIPAGVSEVRYYYELEYDYSNAGVRGTSIKYSTWENYGRPYLARLVNRYPIQLVSARGRVGDQIAVVGSGFTEMDRVRVANLEAETTFRSPNSIEFIVPNLRPDRSYEAVLETVSGDLPLGSFRVDQGALRVTPATLDIASGDVEQVTFSIDGQAPAGGYVINVTTDAPTSVIMPEVKIPAGQKSVSVIVEGGAVGSGNLFVDAPGYGTRQIPISVR